MAYHFTFETADGVKIELPIPPSEVHLKQKTNNETINLINGGDYNVLKSPALKEADFDFLLPHQQYPMANSFRSPTYYTDFFEDCMENQKPVLFSIIREMPNGRILTNTIEWMAIEEFSTKESWDEGFDFVASIKLKQYKKYGTVLYEIVKQDETPVAKPVTNPTNDDKRVDSGSPTTWKVVKGDTLWGIARKCYGAGNEKYWKNIYYSNQELIEKTAKKYGKESSNWGHWIYPGTVLKIPKIK